MKAKLETYNKKGKLVKTQELTGFLTGPDEEEDKCTLYVSLPVGNSKIGHDQHIIISLDQLFGEIKRKLSEKYV